MSRVQIGLGLVVGLLAAGLGLLGTSGHAPQHSQFVWAARRVLMPAMAAVPVSVHTVLPTVAPAGSRPAIAPPRTDHRLTAPPSVSATQIDAILTRYNSPAVGQGAALYDLGVQAGIDPAYALGFWIVESQAGTRGVARSTRSLGNIRCTPGWLRCIEGYRAYDSYAAGMADWYTLIHDLYIRDWNLTTPMAITVRYAPVGDGNDPAAYAAAVVELVNSWAYIGDFINGDNSCYC